VIAQMDADYALWLHAYVDKEDIALLPPERQEFGFAGLGHYMSYPTSRWAEGAIYRDRTVKELAPGEYSFIFGVWLAEPGTRLATPDDPKGAVDLGWQLVGAAEVDARVLSGRGWRKLENDELEGAQEDFEAALAKEPDNLDGLLGVGMVYGAQGESERLSEVSDRLLPLVPNRQDVPLGDVIRFIGYDVQTLSNGQVQVDFYFQAMAAMDADYKTWLRVHVHEEDIALLPSERQQYGFANWPHYMSYPTSRWVEGAIYRDRMVRDLAFGEYHFVFGLWLPDSETYLATPDSPKGTIDLGWHLVGGE